MISRRCHRTIRVARTSHVAQQLPRQTTDTKHCPPGGCRARIPRRHEMSLLIEDLARDRIRQIERDSERARQVRTARKARRSAKSAAANR